MSGLVVVSTLPPDATGTGKTVMWGGLWRRLAERVGYADTTYVYVGPAEPPAVQGSFSVQWIRSPRGREQVVNVLHGTLLRGRPFQESALSGPRLTGELRALVATLRPGIVLADTYRLGALLTGARNYRLITYLDDLFSLRYARMLDALRGRPNLDLDPLGNFGTLLPSFVGRIVALPWVRVRLLASEERRVRRTELEAPAACDLVILINPDEAALLRAWTGSDRIVSVPPLIEVGPPLARRPQPDRPSFLFLGAMNVPHNEVGLSTFLREAFDQLLRRCPGATLDVIGRGVSDELRAAAVPFGDRVRFLGFVDHLEPVLARSTCLLAPLVFGSGVKIKVIEALGRGVPVVATTYGAEGVARSGSGDDGLRVADDWAEFVDAAATLTEPGANARASVAAREHFQRHYAADVVQRLYDAILA